MCYDYTVSNGQYLNVRCSFNFAWSSVHVSDCPEHSLTVIGAGVGFVFVASFLALSITDHEHHCISMFPCHAQCACQESAILV